MTDYITQRFDGAVQLTDWWENPVNGRTHRVVIGKVTILEDTKLVGFKTRSTDSNWIARIEGPSGMSINILGCKIRAVTAWGTGVPAIDNPDAFVVP